MIIIYNNGVLIVRNVSTDLTIYSASDVDIVLDSSDSVFTISSPNVSSSGTSGANFINVVTKSQNTTNKIINKVDVIITYTNSTGGARTANIVLNVNGQDYTQQITFKGKTTRGTVTATFNVNINAAEKFQISASTGANTNYTVFNEEFKFYFAS